MRTFAATAIASSALLSLAYGQEQYQIAPDSVSETTRQFWCNSQITQCPLICLQPPSETANIIDNTCEQETLSFSCVCGDGLSPNVTQYTQTLPYFICQEWGNQCVAACGNGNNACSSACREDHPCGAQDPIRPNSSTISSTMSSSSSSTAKEAGATTDSSGGTIYSGFGGASATGDSSSAQESSASAAADSGVGRASPLNMGQTFGFLALAGAFFGGFALVL
ncbi:hypothetical protein MBLNU13_g04336t1 [Cladosporium sp. NU13]